MALKKDENRQGLKDYLLAAVNIATGIGGILIFMFTMYSIKKIIGR